MEKDLRINFISNGVLRAVNLQKSIKYESINKKKNSVNNNIISKSISVDTLDDDLRLKSLGILIILGNIFLFFEKTVGV